MNFLYRDNKTKQLIEKPYNGSDISIPIEWLDKNIEIFWINIIYPVIDNSNQFQISSEFDYEFTNELHKEYKHFQIVNKIYRKIELSKDDVINNLNNNYGQYLDSQYPQVERLNHTIELLIGTSEERKQYISNLQEWLLKCKEDRKKRINDYLENNTFPSFENFIQKP